MPKTNKYCFVAFEESTDFAALVGWMTHQHMQAVCSPVHDKDIWDEWDVLHYISTNNDRYGVEIDPTADTWERPTGNVTGRGVSRRVETETVAVPKIGQLKKPHRHYVIKLDYSMPYQTFLKLFDDSPLKLSYCEPVRSEVGTLRYLCHLDSPDKARYHRSEVVSLGGYDLSPLYTATRQETVAVCNRIMDKHTTSPDMTIKALTQWAYNEGDFEVFNELRNRPMFWRSVLWVKQKDGTDVLA